MEITSPVETAKTLLGLAIEGEKTSGMTQQLGVSVTGVSGRWLAILLSVSEGWIYKNNREGFEKFWNELG